jgi:hypothetical protein
VREGAHGGQRRAAPRRAAVQRLGGALRDLDAATALIMGHTRSTPPLRILQHWLPATN